MSTARCGSSAATGSPSALPAIAQRGDPPAVHCARRRPHAPARPPAAPTPPTPAASTLTAAATAHFAGESSAKEGHSKPRKVFQKKDLIEAVRKLQPSTTQSQSQVLLAKAVQGKSGAKAGPPSGSVKSSRQVQVMEAGVNLNVKKFNELKILGDRKSTELKEKMDTLVRAPPPPPPPPPPHSALTHPAPRPR